MPRPRRSSKIQIPPRVKGFQPFGNYSDESDPVQLHIEEYEAIRLLDYEQLSQEEAAKIMEISRPTLTRIYERARNKIAIAITEAQALYIGGGSAIYGSNWYQCKACECRFNDPNGVEQLICPLCSSSENQKLN